MIRIVIADDHQLVIDGLTRIFTESEEEITITGTAKTGQELRRQLECGPVDVVILDISMPGMKEAGLLKHVKQQYPQTKVLMLTMHNDADRIKMMLQHKADGYLLKNRSGKEVIKAVRTIHQGAYYFPEDIQRTVFESFIPVEFMEDELKRMALTDKEEEILRLLAAGDQVKAIADKLFVSSKTVEFHKTNLMKKIGARNVQDVVRFAVKNGYESM